MSSGTLHGESFCFLRSRCERHMSAVGLRGQIARRKSPSGSSSAYSEGGAYAPVPSLASRSAAHEGSPAHYSGDAAAESDAPDFASSSASAGEFAESATADAAAAATSADASPEDHARDVSPPRTAAASPERACARATAVTRDRIGIGRGVPRDARRASAARETTRRATRGSPRTVTRARAQTVAIAPAPA